MRHPQAAVRRGVGGPGPISTPSWRSARAAGARRAEGRHLLRRGTYRHALCARELFGRNGFRCSPRKFRRRSCLAVYVQPGLNRAQPASVEVMAAARRDVRPVVVNTTWGAAEQHSAEECRLVAVIPFLAPVAYRSTPSLCQNGRQSHTLCTYCRSGPNVKLGSGWKASGFLGNIEFTHGPRPRGAVTPASARLRCTSRAHTRGDMPAGLSYMCSESWRRVALCFLALVRRIQCGCVAATSNNGLPQLLLRLGSPQTTVSSVSLRCVGLSRRANISHPPSARRYQGRRSRQVPQVQSCASVAARSAAVNRVYLSIMSRLDQPATAIRPPSEPPAASHRDAAVCRIRCR